MHMNNPTEFNSPNQLKGLLMYVRIHFELGSKAGVVFGDNGRT